MRTKFTFTAVVASIALAISAPAAFAQSAVQNGYSQPGGVIQSQVSNGNPSSTPEASTSTPAAKTQTSSSQLPFTGLDLGLVLAAGAMLLAAGLGIRRVSRRTSAV
jgi:hypothetical protein